MLTKCFPFKNIGQYFFQNITRKLSPFISTAPNVITRNVAHINHAPVNSLKRNWLSHSFKPFPLVGVTILSTALWYQVDAKDDAEDNLAHLVQLAKVALERGDVDRAQDILQLGVKLSEDHKLYSSVPLLYDILATIALSQGNVKEAEDLLVAAIEKLTIWGFPDNHHFVIDFKLRLARIYSSLGNESFAKMGFETCLTQQKTKILEGDTSERAGILYINILFWYGVHMIRNSKYDDARNMIKTAYQYSTKIKGLSPKQEMVILYTLADLNAELGDMDTALESILEAVVLGKGIGSIDMPFCYLKLGNIYEKIGYREQAKFAYEEAKKYAYTFGFYDVVSEADEALHNLGVIVPKNL